MQIEIAFIFTQDTWEAQTVFQTSSMRMIMQMLTQYVSGIIEP